MEISWDLVGYTYIHIHIGDIMIHIYIYITYQIISVMDAFGDMWGSKPMKLATGGIFTSSGNQGLTYRHWEWEYHGDITWDI